MTMVFWASIIMSSVAVKFFPSKASSCAYSYIRKSRDIAGAGAHSTEGRSAPNCLLQRPASLYTAVVLSAATHGRVEKICLRSIVTLEVEHLQSLPSVLQSSSALTTRARVQTRTMVQV